MIDVIVEFVAIHYGLMSFASFLPIMPAIQHAFLVLEKVYDLIEREPKIHSPNQSDMSANCHDIKIKDGIHFEDVHFRYPVPKGQDPVVF